MKQLKTLLLVMRCNIYKLWLRRAMLFCLKMIYRILITIKIEVQRIEGFDGLIAEVQRIEGFDGLILNN
ncbi:MAG: hypothetical protein DRR19_24120 [Candidatus Parabeggiatoa sp. nov. 1]|nr:MAG: hypothetical protein DRR19_24120 [Gammaproteobacteria bacterium]